MQRCLLNSLHELWLLTAKLCPIFSLSFAFASTRSLSTCKQARITVKKADYFNTGRSHTLHITCCAATRIMKLRCATRAHVIHIYMQLSLLHWPYYFLAIQYICYMSSHENEFHLCGTLRSTQIKKLWYAKRAHPIYICIYWTLSTAVIHIRFSQSYAFTVWVHDQIQWPWQPNLTLREF